MNKRILFDVILLGSIFYAPWWLIIILALIAAFLWPPYYEVIVFGILVDLMYGAHTLLFNGVSGLLTAIVIFFVASYARKSVR